MRKLLMVVVASGALIALMPATALAKHSRRHHRAHHGRLHHKKFGTNPAPPTAPSGTTTPVNTAPSTTMSVVSFTGGVLTISDANGQNISGTVTADTRLICISQQPPNTSPPNTSPSNTAPTGTWQGHDHGGGDWGGGDHGGGGNDQGDHHGHNQCTTANLVAGTPVQFADLSLSSKGTNWDVVVLQVAPSTAPPGA